jgi:hypothetical protein
MSNTETEIVMEFFPDWLGLDYDDAVEASSSLSPRIVQASASSGLKRKNEDTEEDKQDKQDKDKKKAKRQKKVKVDYNNYFEQFTVKKGKRGDWLTRVFIKKTGSKSGNTDAMIYCE